MLSFLHDFKSKADRTREKAHKTWEGQNFFLQKQLFYQL